jgi:predicted enzyme related to lactoylglutathione lyase
MARLTRSVPIFAVPDIAAAFEHYQRLGFSTRAYSGGGYGYLTRDAIEIHLAGVRDLDPATNTCAAYVWVDDADALAAEWRAAGAEIVGPTDTDWGLHEGNHVDPFGNLIRFGNPL